eukprot:scaffold8477_cov112-Isochrysis_galbana.AAC.15
MPHEPPRPMPSPSPPTADAHTQVWRRLVARGHPPRRTEARLAAEGCGACGYAEPNSARRGTVRRRGMAEPAVRRARAGQSHPLHDRRRSADVDAIGAAPNAARADQRRRLRTQFS